MPRGDKSSYTEKQKRQAEHIEEGYEKRGVAENEAERRAWATANKQDHLAGCQSSSPISRSVSRCGICTSRIGASCAAAEDSRRLVRGPAAEPITARAKASVTRLF